MNLSVIFTTYNATEWLEKVLWGYSVQTFRDFEIIIADDGSSAETRQLIEIFRKKTSLDIKHVWHEDKGFRKCRILNKAIVAAENDYLVFSDGDCIPRKDFLQVHHDQAEEGRYLSGGYHKLPMSTSKAISKEDILSTRCFELEWLKENGLPPTYKNKKLTASYSEAKWLNMLTPTKCNFKGSNASCWKKDAIAINGFDERMQWGGLDREFGVRLKNLGIKPKHVRYNAICIHLDHARGYKDPEMVASNKALRLDNEKSGEIYTQHGISQLETANQ